MKQRAPRRGLRAPRPPTCSRPTASRPNCSRPWPPSATWPSTGRAFARRWSSTAIESGGGQKVELFRHDPLDALKKALHGSRFLGYETLEVADAKVIGIIASDQLCDQIDEVDHEQPIVVVLDKTPFYGEMGGQVGDTGEIVGPGFRFEVIDTQIDGGFTLHRGHLREGKLELGRDGHRPGRRRAPAGHPPRPLGHAPAALRPAKAPRQARPAAGLEGRRRLAAVRLRQPVGRQPRGAGRDRRRSEREGPRRRADRAGRTCRWPRPARPAP